MFGEIGMAKKTQLLSKKDIERARTFSAVIRALLDLPQNSLEKLSEAIERNGIKMTPKQVQFAIRELLGWKAE